MTTGLLAALVLGPILVATFLALAIVRFAAVDGTLLNGPSDALANLLLLGTLLSAALTPIAAIGFGIAAVLRDEPSLWSSRLTWTVGILVGLIALFGCLI